MTAQSVLYRNTVLGASLQIPDASPVQRVIDGCGRISRGKYWEYVIATDTTTVPAPCRAGSVFHL